MILQVSKTIFKKMWPLFVLLAVINGALFGVDHQDENYFHFNEFFAQFTLGLFGIQNILYAVAIFGSAKNRALWRQLFNSEIRLHLTLIPAFVVASIFTQFIPVLIIMMTSEDPAAPVVLLDVLGLGYTWGFALFGYLYGAVLCWWRKGSFILVLPSMPIFFFAVKASVAVQLVTLAVLFLLAAVYVVGNKNIRTYVVATMVTFGCGLLFMALVSAFTPDPWKSTVALKKAHSSALKELATGAVDADMTRIDTSISLRPRKASFDQASLVYKYDAIKADWINYELSKLRERATQKQHQWMQSKPVIETFWRERHASQVPVSRKNYHEQALIIFKDAIYQQAGDESEVPLWQASSQNEWINWVERGEQRPTYQLVFFGNDKHINWLYSDVNYAQSIGTIATEERLVRGTLVSYVGNEDTFNLLLTFEKSQSIYEWTDFTKPPVLLKTTELNVDKKTRENATKLISASGVALAGLAQGLKLDSLGEGAWWLLLSHLLAVGVSLIWFSASDRKQKMGYALYSFILAWPAVIALMFCFAREHRPQWQTQPER